MSYLPSILITVAGNGNDRYVSKRWRPAASGVTFTFLGTLQLLALDSVERGHLVRLAGWSADASAVHGPDAEMVCVAHFQAMNRVFANIDGGVVALDPGVTAGFTPVHQTSCHMSSLSF